jgi:AcrR family transcriptional regulator
MTKPYKHYTRKLSRKKVFKALTNGTFCGSYTELAERCGVARATITTFLEKPENTDLLQLFRDEMEKLIDVAEDRVAHRVDKDDWAAITFLLRTKGKYRGWGEAPLIALPDGAIRIELVPIGFEIPKQIEDVVEVEEIEHKTTTDN